jgi:hypothetical protein
MRTDYSKIFTGNSLLANRIVAALHEQGIGAVIKDEAESARLSGFASSMLGTVELYVNNDEVQLAETIVLQTQSQ